MRSDARRYAAKRGKARQSAVKRGKARQNVADEPSALPLREPLPTKNFKRDVGCRKSDSKCQLEQGMSIKDRYGGMSNGCCALSLPNRFVRIQMLLAMSLPKSSAQAEISELYRKRSKQLVISAAEVLYSSCAHNSETVARMESASNVQPDWVHKAVSQALSDFLQQLRADDAASRAADRMYQDAHFAAIHRRIDDIDQRVQKNQCSCETSTGASASTWNSSDLPSTPPSQGEAAPHSMLVQFADCDLADPSAMIQPDSTFCDDEIDWIAKSSFNDLEDATPLCLPALPAAEICPGPIALNSPIWNSDHSRQSLGSPTVVGLPAQSAVVNSPGPIAHNSPTWNSDQSSKALRSPTVVGLPAQLAAENISGPIVHNAKVCALCCFRFKHKRCSDLLLELFTLILIVRHCKQHMQAAFESKTRCRFIPGFLRHELLIECFSGNTPEHRWRNFVDQWCRKC
jgi:hypothetical protein